MFIEYFEGTRRFCLGCPCLLCAAYTQAWFLYISPAKALWVTVFFLALDEILGDFIMPKVRSSTMNIHPASINIVLLGMAAAFGATEQF